MEYMLHWINIYNTAIDATEKHLQSGTSRVLTRNVFLMLLYRWWKEKCKPNDIKKNSWALPNARGICLWELGMWPLKVMYAGMWLGKLDLGIMLTVWVWVISEVWLRRQVSCSDEQYGRAFRDRRLPLKMAKTHGQIDHTSWRWICEGVCICWLGLQLQYWQYWLYHSAYKTV